MFSRSSPVNDAHLLTVQDLLAMEENTALGYWKVYAPVHNRVTSFIILKHPDDEHKGYMLAIAAPILVIGYRRTLAQIVDLYNEFIKNSRQRQPARIAHSAKQIHHLAGVR